MVYAFLVLSLEEAQQASLADNSCLISAFFTAEGNNEHRVTRQLAVCEEVMRQFVFQSQTRSKSASPSELVFRVPASTLFATEKVVMSRNAGSCMYILLLDRTDNRALASHFLVAFPRLLSDHFRSTSFASSPKQFVSKIDEVLLLVQRTLPGGILSYLTPLVTRAVRRDVDETLTATKA